MESMTRQRLPPLLVACLCVSAVSAQAQPDSGAIRVRSAFYGSSEAGPGGMIRTTSSVSAQCDGKAACALKCSARSLGVYNPYPHHPKSCRISYSCGDKIVRTLVVSAGASAKLDCASP